MPNRPVRGCERSPALVVAPTSVKGGSLSSTVRAPAPEPMSEVELPVFHRRVEDLLDGRRHPVHLVDEEDVARREVRQERGEVARLLEDGARRDADLRPHLARHDVGQRRLPEARRPREKDVVERLAPAERGLDEDAERLLQLRLADEVAEGARPERGLAVRLLRLEDSRQNGFVHGQTRLSGQRLQRGLEEGVQVLDGDLPCRRRDGRLRLRRLVAEVLQCGNGVVDHRASSPAGRAPRRSRSSPSSPSARRPAAPPASVRRRESR